MIPDHVRYKTKAWFSVTVFDQREVNKVMKTKKKGNNWTAYYDEDNGRYFAEIKNDPDKC